MPRRISALLCIAVACLSACVSARPLRDSSPVRVGFLADLSGGGAADGMEALKGAELRVVQINDAGGVGGRRIELFSLDTKDRPADTVKAYTQLVQDDGVCAVIGAAPAASGMAVGPVADLSRVPLLSLGIDDRMAIPDVKPDNPDQTGKPRDFVFLLSASAIQSAQALAWYAAEHFALKRFATFYDAVDPVSVLQAHAFESTVRRAGRAVAASVPLPTGDMAPAVRLMARAGVDAVYVCNSVETNAAAARALREFLPQAVLLGNPFWYSPVAAPVEPAAENAWFALPLSPDDPGVAEITGAFSARFGAAPRPGAVSGWDAVGVVAAAVRKAGTSVPGGVRDALEQAVAFPILRGQLDMDRRTHRPLLPSVAIMQIRGGAYRTVDPRYVHRPLHS